MYAPYTHCEWKNVTYGISETRNRALRRYEQLKMDKMIQDIQNNQSNTRDVIALVIACMIPTLVLTTSLLIFVK